MSQSGKTTNQPEQIQPRRKIPVTIQAAIWATAAAVAAALIACFATIFSAWIGSPSFGKSTAVPPSPTPFCMSADDIFVKIHVLNNKDQELALLTPGATGATFFIEPGVIVFFQVEPISVYGITLPTPDCAWKNTGVATGNKLLHDSSCIVDYQSGLKDISDAVSVQLSQPSCPALPPYAIFIEPK